MNNFSYSTKELANMIGKIQVGKVNSYPTKVEKIGLTGASGFLGMHLIEQLVQDKNISKIKCFIRSKDTFNIRKSLFNLNFSEEKLDFHFDFNEKNTQDLDLFIHSAAQVHNIKKLSGLWADNVELTKKVVEQVCCPIAYISTLSVYASSNMQGVHTPHPCEISDEHVIYGGYAQSKWLGEYLMQQRKDTKIIRLGLLTPSTVKPILQENEFFSLFLKLSKDFSYYPEGFEESLIDISPIDLASKEIIGNLHLENKYVHIANMNGTSIKNFIQSLDLKEITLDDWKKHIDGLKKTEKILLSYAYFKSQSLKEYPNYFNIDLFQTTGHNWCGSIFMSEVDKYILNVSNQLKQ
jgi:thioester reductase-like protein